MTSQCVTHLYYDVKINVNQDDCGTNQEALAMSSYAFYAVHAALLVDVRNRRSSLHCYSSVSTVHVVGS